MDCEEMVYSNDVYDFIVEYTSISRDGPLSDCVQNISPTYDIAYVEREGLLPLSVSTYTYTAIPKCFTLVDKAALDVSGILRLQNYPNLSLNGMGVLVGFVDTGIDYQNMVFRNADGSSRIAAIWDQTDRGGTPPEGFLYGSEYKQEQISAALRTQMPEALVPSTDTDGHGTFIASVAAGSNRPEEDFIGAAPYSQIAMVKLKGAKQYLREFYFIPEDAKAYQENDIMAGVAYLNRLAEQMNMPLVLCICLGSNLGSHGGVASPLVTILDYVGLLRRRAVVVAAGNEGNQRKHFYGQIPETQEYLNVEINVGTGVTGFTMEMWARAPELFVIELISPSGERIPRESVFTGSHEYTFLFEGTRVTVDYRVAGYTSANQVIYVRFINPVQGIWNIRVYRQLAVLGEFHMWLPMEELMSGSVYFIRSNPDVTITVPGNAQVPMTVTAYDGRDGSIYLEAGRGFTVTGAVKPDYAAPGVEVYGAGLRNQFITRTGTCGAAAVAAGAVALLMEWAIVRGNYTTISNTEIKNMLIRGAEQDPERQYPNREWGYGKLNLYQAFELFRRR